MMHWYDYFFMESIKIEENVEKGLKFSLYALPCKINHQ